MRKIIWSWPLLFVLAGLLMIVFGGYYFARHEESPLPFIGSFILISIGVFFYSRVREKKEGQRKLIIRKKKNEQGYNRSR